MELEINLHTQVYFFRKVPAINATFPPTYVHLQVWSLKLEQNIKIFGPKFSNGMQEQTQVNKT